MTERFKPADQSDHPFPGLRPFEQHEAHLFFGREGQSATLVHKLAVTKFLSVLGTSGSGKSSSFVRASCPHCTVDCWPLPDPIGGSHC